MEVARKVAVSFIVPVYNGERYLRECLDSILGQSFRDFEIIIVNDGSVDGSQGIIDEYAGWDSRITPLTQENRGVSAARNAALDLALGEYIWFLDCDDALLKGALEAMYRCAVETEADLVIGNYQIYHEFSGRLERAALAQGRRTYQEEEKIACMYFDCFPGNKLWKRSAIEQNALRFQWFRIGEDLDFYLRFLALAHRIALLEAVMFFYRFHEESCCRVFSEKQLDIIAAFDHVKAFYLEYGGMEDFLKELEFLRLLRYWHGIAELPQCADRTVRLRILDAFLDGEQKTEVLPGERETERVLKLRVRFAAVRKHRGFYNSVLYVAYAWAFRMKRKAARLIGWILFHSQRALYREAVQRRG